LRAAFHQVVLDIACRELTAFTCPMTGKKYQFTRLFYGEKGVISKMQEEVERVLGVGTVMADCVKAYVDNVMIATFEGGVEEHGAKLVEVIERMMKAGLKL
jgi:hypothetical protein